MLKAAVNSSQFAAMKRNFFALSVLLAILSGAAIAESPREKNESESHGQSEKAIKQLLDRFIEAWNRHDAKEFSLVFAEDADFTNVGGKSAHGRTEVEKFHAPKFATNLKDSHQKITETKIRFITRDVAAVDARWEMTGARRADGQEVALRKGLLNFIMTRANGEWLIKVMHNMDLSERPNS